MLKQLFICLLIISGLCVQTPAQPLASEVAFSSVSLPIYATAPVGDDNRLFIVQQRFFGMGQIRVGNLNTGRLQTEYYLEVGPVGSLPEQGLLGLAFHPQFMQNGYLYVTYTSPAVAGVTAGDVFLVRYRATGGNPLATTADPASATLIFMNRKPESTHNGGWIGFGADGYLYMATGDGGNANDTNGAISFPPFHTPGTGNAQDLTDNLLGKVLRLDVNGPDGLPGTADDDGFPADPNKNYSIPPTNPYVGTQNSPEIWASGLRNPWRCSIDRQTGDFWSGDVGQGQREEINFNPGNQPGLNYGWRCKEGTLCTGLSGCTCSDPTLTDPIYEYNHSVGCAVVGGYVYRGCAIPWLRGTYFYTDFCSADFFSFRLQNGQVTELTDRTAQLDPPGPQTNLTIVSFGEDARGELYYCDSDAGRVMRIVDPASLPRIDCNNNRRDDRCDISVGVSNDINQDGIPDECQDLCPADFNQDGGVTGQDIEDFYLAWEVSLPSADVNYDGGVDGQDVETFFIVWESGGCA